MELQPKRRQALRERIERTLLGTFFGFSRPAEPREWALEIHKNSPGNQQGVSKLLNKGKT